jgi:hypothetical protein
MLARLLNKVFQSDKITHEYYMRFIHPIRLRAESLGMPSHEFMTLYNFARQAANPTVVGQAPGAILSNLIDHWEADRVSCMQFIAEESKALGYKYTPLPS